MDRKKRSPAGEKGKNQIVSVLCLERVICKHVLLRPFQKLISDPQQCPITLKYPVNELITLYIFNGFYFEKKYFKQFVFYYTMYYEYLTYICQRELQHCERVMIREPMEPFSLFTIITSRSFFSNISHIIDLQICIPLTSKFAYN